MFSIYSFNDFKVSEILLDDFECMSVYVHVCEFVLFVCVRERERESVFLWMSGRDTTVCALWSKLWQFFKKIYYPLYFMYGSCWYLLGELSVEAKRMFCGHQDQDSQAARRSYPGGGRRGMGTNQGIMLNEYDRSPGNLKSEGFIIWCTKILNSNIRIFCA